MCDVQRSPVQDVGEKHNNPVKNFKLVSKVLQSKGEQLQKYLGENRFHRLVGEMWKGWTLTSMTKSERMKRLAMWRTKAGLTPVLLSSVNNE